MIFNANCAHHGKINHHGRVRSVAENGFGIPTKKVSWIPGNVINGHSKENATKSSK